MTETDLVFITTIRTLLYFYHFSILQYLKTVPASGQ